MGKYKQFIDTNPESIYQHLSDYQCAKAAPLWWQKRFSMYRHHSLGKPNRASLCRAMSDRFLRRAGFKWREIPEYEMGAVVRINAHIDGVHFSRYLSDLIAMLFCIREEGKGVGAHENTFKALSDWKGRWDGEKFYVYMSGKIFVVGREEFTSIFRLGQAERYAGYLDKEMGRQSA